VGVDHQRFLPYRQPEGAGIFVTWRLHGSLPRGVVEAKKEETDGRRFVRFDRMLDQAGFGPDWLRRPAIASAVAETLIAGDMRRDLYRLRAWVVMPNHVHALWLPNRPMPEIMQWVKGTSGRRINRMLGREGEAFWQDESYDRLVRSSDEGERIVRYIERNPVTAGLVRRIEDWEWSSAYDVADKAPLRGVGTG
jgi:putative transposase